jgi:hypothetical protein
MEAYFEYQSTKERDNMRKLFEDFRRMAVQFCDEHDVTCCTRKFIKYCHFQCKYNHDPIIACYHEATFQCHDIEQVENILLMLQPTR